MSCFYVMHTLLKRGVHQTPTLHFNLRFWGTVGARERSWTVVDGRERNDPPPISKTLVMVQSDPTRTPTQLIRIDVR